MIVESFDFGAVKQNAAGYQICTSQGPLESFDRQYLDLIQSAFLKYQFSLYPSTRSHLFSYSNIPHIAHKEIDFHSLLGSKLK
jgi:hypothetical protein